MAIRNRALDECEAMAPAWPAWHIWLIWPAVGGGPTWCARRRDDTGPVLNTHSGARLAELLAEVDAKCPHRCKAGRDCGGCGCPGCGWHQPAPLDAS